MTTQAYEAGPGIGEGEARLNAWWAETHENDWCGEWEWRELAGS
jgi:hypothetical protein